MTTQEIQRIRERLAIGTHRSDHIPTYGERHSLQWRAPGYITALLSEVERLQKQNDLLAGAAERLAKDWASEEGRLTGLVERGTTGLNTKRAQHSLCYCGPGVVCWMHQWLADAGRKG